MTNCRCQGIACETEDREHVEARDPAWLRSNAPSNTSATRRRRLPNFARNLSWSFFETPQKHCNSNDANSMIEQAAGELRAKLMGSGGAWPGFEATRRAKLAARTARGRAAAHRHTQRPGPPAPGTSAGPQATTRENKNRRSRRICGFIVREGGVEPPLHHWNTDLNRARLPIPPLARTQKE